MNKPSDTQQTQPTDSQMLDFLIDNGAYINAFHVFNGVHCYVIHAHDLKKNWPPEIYDDPRQAIAAEMEKEAK